MALTEEDLHKIATNAGLKLAGVDAYIKFMQTRFPKEGSRSYAEEWAERFKSGNPFAYADTQSKKALLNAYGVKGWRGESARHSLARKGIKTGRKK